MVVAGAECVSQPTLSVRVLPFARRLGFAALALRVHFARETCWSVLVDKSRLVAVVGC